MHGVECVGRKFKIPILRTWKSHCKAIRLFTGSWSEWVRMIKILYFSPIYVSFILPEHNRDLTDLKCLYKIKCLAIHHFFVNLSNRVTDIFVWCWMFETKKKEFLIWYWECSHSKCRSNRISLAHSKWSIIVLVHQFKSKFTHRRRSENYAFMSIQLNAIKLIGGDWMALVGTKELLHFFVRSFQHSFIKRRWIERTGEQAKNSNAENAKIMCDEFESSVNVVKYV